MYKEYFYAEFQVDGKKFKFKTDGERLTEVKFKIKFPNEFGVLKAYFEEDNTTIRIDFVGYCGCTLADGLKESTSLKKEDVKVEIGDNHEIPSMIKVGFHLTEVENCDKDNFVPETAGGGILVGTGG